ncbi:MAG: hypothetical protein ABI346_00020 [Candidatus Baltobacteraceae bacterium]|jgi:hypothetical protein
MSQPREDGNNDEEDALVAADDTGMLGNEIATVRSSIDEATAEDDDAPDEDAEDAP